MLNLIYGLILGLVLGFIASVVTYCLYTKKLKRRLEEDNIVGTLGIPEKYVDNMKRSSCCVIKVKPGKITYSYNIGASEETIFGATFNSRLGNFSEIDIIGEFVDGPRLCSLRFDEINNPIKGTINIIIL